MPKRNRHREALKKASLPAREPLRRESHREEAEFLRETLWQAGYPVSLWQAEGIWSAYSDTLAAGWLGMPTEAGELLRLVDPYL